MTADVNSPIKRGFHGADSVRWDDCSERLAAKHELTRTELQHDQCIRRARGRDQGTVINVL